VDPQSGLINYSAFCDTIDEVFGEAANTNEVIEKSRSSAVNQPMLIFSVRTSQMLRRML